GLARHRRRPSGGGRGGGGRGAARPDADPPLHRGGAVPLPGRGLRVRGGTGRSRAAAGRGVGGTAGGPGRAVAAPAAGVGRGRPVRGGGRGRHRTRGLPARPRHGRTRGAAGEPGGCGPGGCGPGGGPGAAMTGIAAPEAAPGVRETLRGTSGPVRAILLGILINRTGAFLQVFLVLYLVHAGYTPVQAGLALGLHGAGGVVGGVVGGRLTDRIGSRHTMLLGNGLAGVLTVGVPAAPGYPAVLAVVILIGLCGNAFRPAAAAALAAHTPPERYTMVFAAQRLATNIGTTVGPLLGAAILAVSYPA